MLSRRAYRRASATSGRGSKAQKGQGALEYAVALAVIALLVMALLKWTGHLTSGGICQVSTGLASNQGGCTVETWGSNSFGQLGTTAIATGGSTPTPQSLASFSAGIVGIGNGEHTSAAVLRDGSVWTWGYNGNGELGNNTSNPSNVPVQVHGVGNVGFLGNITSVGCGSYHCLAVDSSGHVWAWGNNGNGELGNGTAGSAVNSTPTEVKDVGGSGNISNVVSVGGGDVFSEALKSDGTVWSWGGNTDLVCGRPPCYDGFLGDGTTVDKSSPVQVHGPAYGSFNDGFLHGITQLGRGVYVTLAVRNDGTAWCWGSDWNGNCGQNTSNNTSNSGYTSPVEVKNTSGVCCLTGVASAGAGENNSFALLTNGTVVDWAYNQVGELGYGVSSTNPLFPVQVVDTSGSGTLSKITEVVQGGEGSAALSSSGAVYTWGDNSLGQLGTGSGGGASTIPVKATGITDATGIGEGYQFLIVTTRHST